MLSLDSVWKMNRYSLRIKAQLKKKKFRKKKVKI